MEREDVGDGPFLKPNSSISLESSLLGHSVHTDIEMDVDVASIGMADIIDKVWVSEYVGS